MEAHAVVSQQEWLAARKALLAKEKAFTRARDALSEERRALPWVKIEKSYVFDGPSGKETLSSLFGGRSQLIVKHFMFGPDWEEGCVCCSVHADHIDGALQHLEHHDVSLVAVARAPIERIQVFKRRMGWRFTWVSSFGSDFNHDFNVSYTPEQIERGEMFYNYEMRRIDSDELSGVSVFYKDASGDIFHTYSCFARGGEMFLGAYAYLDVTPKGRDETKNGNLTDWVLHHDKYDAVDARASCCA